MAKPAKNETAPEVSPLDPVPEAPRELDGLVRALILAKDSQNGEDPVPLMTAGGAQLLVAYLIARQDALPKDIVAFAKTLRANSPMVWKPLQGMNYIGFSNALGLCGLPRVDHAELQNACTALAVKGRADTLTPS